MRQVVSFHDSTCSNTLPGEAFDGAVRTIDVHIRHLRQKIEPDARNPRYIETIFGIGYRFMEK